MAITVSGILRSPQGLALQNAELLFEQTRTTEEVLQGTKFSINTQLDGAYSSTLGVGVFTFKIRFQEDTQYKTIASNVIVSQAMDNYSINQIIQDQSQMQDVDYDLLQAVLQARDTQVQQATEASQSQAQAQVSQTSSQASQNYSQQQQEASQSSQQSQAQSQSQQATSQSNAKGSETQAQQSQTNAATNAQQAQASKDQQHQSAVLAGESKDQAKASQDQQKISETNQQGSQQYSQASQANAALSEQSQLQSKDAAKVSETNAQSSAQAQLVSQNQQAQSQSNASLSEATALASKNQAAISQDQQHSSAQHSETNKEEAKAWASKPEDQIVQEGLYSARHYAAKAASYAQTQLGQLIWRGGWSAQSGQTPPNPTGSTQDFYRITQAGTILGISYDVGDYIHWDNINSIWFKMDGTDSVTSVNGETGQVTLTQKKVGAVESHTWLAKVKLGTWSAIGKFYPYLLGGKAIVTVGMTRGNFVANARFLISWGHAQPATITQLESHGYSQIMVRVGTSAGDSCIFSILDEDYGIAQQGDEVAYFCQVDSLFGQLDKYTSFTEDTSIAKSTINTEYMAIKIGNNKVYHQGFKPSAAEVGAYPMTGGQLGGPLHAKHYVIAGSLNGQNWTALGATDDSLPWISARVNGTEQKVLEFNATGETIIHNNTRVKGEVSSSAWGNAFSTIGGFIRSNNASVMSMDGKTYSFITSPADAHLCQNSFWDGAEWHKYNVDNPSGSLVVRNGTLQFQSSDAGVVNPLQKLNFVYHTGHRPTPAEIGAAPDGFGVGGYGATIGTVLGDCNLRRQGGLFNGSSIAGIPTEGHPWKYVINACHANEAGYFGYIAMDFDLGHAWLGGQSGGVQKSNKKFVFQLDRITAAGAIGSDYNNSSIEVIGSGGGIKPTIGFHQPSEFAASMSLWLGDQFRFHTQGVAGYAGLMLSVLDAQDVYIRSDARLKTNLVKLGGAIDKICSLTAYSYDKKETLKSTEYTKHEVGLIAQDVERVLPEAISRVIDSNDKTGTEVLTISTPAITALLVEAVKELKAELDELRRIAYGS